jgi:hypothetical protein
LGGVCSGIPGSVWELVMIQQQRFGGSLVGTPARLVADYGVTSLGRGITMTMGAARSHSSRSLKLLGFLPLSLSLSLSLSVLFTPNHALPYAPFPHAASSFMVHLVKMQAESRCLRWRCWA